MFASRRWKTHQLKEHDSLSTWPSVINKGARFLAYLARFKNHIKFSTREKARQPSSYKCRVSINSMHLTSRFLLDASKRTLSAFSDIICVQSLNENCSLLVNGQMCLTYFCHFSRFCHAMHLVCKFGAFLETLFFDFELEARFVSFCDLRVALL